MNFGTVCSGIGAPEQAWHSLGWKCAFESEIKKFPSAVLSQRWPDVPNHGNLLTHKEWPEHAIRLICAGTPCQSFSLAGLRKGLADPRGNLTLAFLGVIARYSPRWVVWENVPGILSDRGNAFGSFLTGLAECGYGTAYRVLDAQYFGLAQRRKRVFVVGYFGDWRPAAAVLFERESLSWNPAPSREAGKRVAPTIEGRAGRSGANNFATSGGLIERANPLRGQAQHSHLADSDNLIAGTIASSGAGTARTGNERNESDFLVCHALKADGHDASEDGTGRGVPLIASAVSSKWAKGTGGPSGDEAQNLLPVAFNHQSGGSQAMLNPRTTHTDALSKSQTIAVKTGYGVRRLTPRECERLMGLPDDYTLVEYRNKPAKDGPRYKALGNSMAVPVMNWLGRRIEMVEKLQAELVDTRPWPAKDQV